MSKSSLAVKHLDSQAPIQTQRRALSPFQARRLKRNLILAFCEESISASAVSEAFKIFEELRSA